MNWSAQRPLWAAILGSVVLLCCCVSGALALQVGDKAPEFTLPGTTAEVKLADYLGKKPVVLFFYIGAFTNT